MSYRFNTLATALVVHVMLYSSHPSYAGTTPLSTVFEDPHADDHTSQTKSFLFSPSGAPLVQRETVEHADLYKTVLLEEEPDTWEAFMDNGYVFPIRERHKGAFLKQFPEKRGQVQIIPESQNHDYRLPPDFVAAWIQAPKQIPLSSTEEYLRARRLEPMKQDAKAHANAVAEDFLIKGVPQKRHYLRAPNGFNARQYFLNNFSAMADELPLLPDIDIDWKSPTRSEVLSWSLDTDWKEIEWGAIRHFYNFGHADIKVKKGDETIIRPALHWYKLPEELNDWRQILRLNPSLVALMEDDLGDQEILDPTKAMWTYNYIFNHGDENYSFIEGIPEGFDWEAYKMIVDGMRTELFSKGGKSSDAADLDDGQYVNPYKLAPYIPASQDRGKFMSLMLEAVMEVQKHFLQHSRALGLINPLLPETFDPMGYLRLVWSRAKKEIAYSKDWSLFQKQAWAKSDYFLNVWKWIRSGRKGDEPIGYILPQSWDIEEHWGLKRQVARQLADEPDRDVKAAKTVIFAQAKVHDDWEAVNPSLPDDEEHGIVIHSPRTHVHAGSGLGEQRSLKEEGPHSKTGPLQKAVIPDDPEVALFEANIPEWANMSEYLDEDLNPDLKENIIAELREERGQTPSRNGMNWEKMSPGEKHMLIHAKAQQKFVEGEGRRTVAPDGFSPEAYYDENVDEFAQDEAFRIRNPRERALALEHHYVERGRHAGKHYRDMRGVPELPEWANETHYFEQNPFLRKMAHGLTREAKRTLMRQHFFTEGYEQGLTLAPIPHELAQLEEFDEEAYERQAASDFHDVLTYLQKKKRGRKRELLLAHFAGDGHRSGLQLNPADTREYRPSDLIPQGEHVGILQGDGSIKVEDGDSDGEILTLEDDLQAGVYKVHFQTSSSAEDKRVVGEVLFGSGRSLHPIEVVSRPEENVTYHYDLTLQKPAHFVMKVRSRDGAPLIVRGIRIEKVRT